MRRLGNPPNSFTLQTPTSEAWFATVGERLNLYTGTTFPTTTQLPQGQWALWFNPTTKALQLIVNYGGVIYTMNGGGGPFGYSAGQGAGGTATQPTSKSTGFTLNTRSGQITTASDALAAGASASFNVSNSLITGTEIVKASVVSNAVDCAKYSVRAGVFSGNIRFTIKNETAGSLSEAVTFNFIVFQNATT